MTEKMTFEEAMAQLDRIVARLDAGEASLDESLELFGQGAILVGFCNQKLQDAKQTIETLFPEDEVGNE